MKDIKIAIYSSNGFQETFTKAHIDLLPVAFVVTEGTPPRMVNGKPMLSMNKFQVLRRKMAGIFGVKPDSFAPLNTFFSNNKVDVFIAEFGMAGAAITETCKRYKIPLIVNFYGIDAFGHKFLKENKEKYQVMFSYASFISTQSDSIRKQLITIGCPDNKIVVNSCPPSEKFFTCNPSLQKPILIAIGRFVDKKAPFLTILAFNEILKNQPQAELIMAGDGPLLNASILLAKSLKLDHKIRFVGRVDSTQQMELMNEASIFIQHSVIAPDGDAEGLPVAIMEASAMGIPVVSTFHSGIPEAVQHEKSGFLVEEGDFIKMSEYCIQLLSSLELRKIMGEYGRSKMKNEFTMNAHVEKINELIRRSVHEQK